MKKLIFSIFAATALFCGCQTFDDSEIQGRLDDIELRLSKLETQINDNAQAISKIVNAVSVSSVTPVENGFAITFSDGTTYTITNGKDGENGIDGTDGTNGVDGVDGQAPVLGVQFVDGILCWTVNGELIKDEKGNYVPCQSEPKLTPEFKVEGEQWYCTFDGENWTKVSPGVATSVISFVETDTAIIFTIDGEKFTIAKAAVFSLKIDNDYLCLNPEESVNIAYTLAGGDETVNFSIEAYLYSATINEEARTITFTAPEASVNTDGGYVIIKAIRNSDGAITAQYVGFEKGEISVIGDYFEVPVAGGAYQVKVTTNMTYDINIDCNWITIPETKAVRTDVIDVTVAESKTFIERTGKLTITSTKGEKFVTVFKQAAYDDGTTMGVPQRPYVISTLDDLLSVPSKLIKYNDMEVYFELAADIDMAGANFSASTGSAGIDPSGECPINFDGKDHTISGFKAEGGSGPSFFGYLWGHVANVTFDGAEVSASGEKAAVVAASVGLTGWDRDHAGYLENVHVTNSNVTHALTDGTGAAWGGQSGIIAGELMCEGSYIKNCSAIESTVTGIFCCGGIVGQTDNGTLVDGCCIKGSTVTCAGINPGYDASFEYNWNDKGWINPTAYNDFNVECGYVGGIVGIANFSTIQNCYNDYASSATLNNTGRYGGGIVGVVFAKATVQNCWAGCYVNAGVNAGGVIGGTAWYCGGGNIIKNSIAWNRIGYSEAAVEGGNDSGNFMGNMVDPNNKSVCYYGLSEIYDCYTSPALILHAGGWGTGTFANNSCPTGPAALANIHGWNTSDIIGTAQSLGWSDDVWDFSGELPTLDWEGLGE